MNRLYVKSDFLFPARQTLCSHELGRKCGQLRSQILGLVFQKTFSYMHVDILETNEGVFVMFSGIALERWFLRDKLIGSFNRVGMKSAHISFQNSRFCSSLNWPWLYISHNEFFNVLLNLSVTHSLSRSREDFLANLDTKFT